nr:p28 auxiliary replication protein [Turnip crinkle virus]
MPFLHSLNTAFAIGLLGARYYPEIQNFLGLPNYVGQAKEAVRTLIQGPEVVVVATHTLGVRGRYSSRGTIGSSLGCILEVPDKGADVEIDLDRLVGTDEEATSCLVEAVGNTADIPRRRVRQKGRFAMHAVNAAKLHFCGVPKPTEANRLAVSKWLVQYCKERHVVTSHIRTIVNVALPRVFTPDAEDIQVVLDLHSVRAHNHRNALAEAGKVQKWWVNLAMHPLTGRSWNRAWRRLCRMPDDQALTFVR